MKEKIFIAGATGFIGIRVCSELFKKDYPVHALLRPGESDTAIREYIAATVEGDLLVEDHCGEIEAYLSKEKIPYMISLVGGVDYHQDHETSRRINVDTARNIISVAEKVFSKGILKKLVFGGSVASRGFFRSEGNPPRQITEETDEYRKGAAIYGDVKREAEEIVHRAFKDHGLPAVIVQPGSLVGPEVGSATTTTVGLIRRALKGVPVLSGGASYTSVEAVASGIIAALEKGTPGESYLLGGENMTMKEFTRLVRTLARENFPELKLSHFSPPAIHTPVAHLLGGLGIMLNSQQALLGSTFHYIDSTKANRELDYEHDSDKLKEAILAVLRTL